MDACFILHLFSVLSSDFRILEKKIYNSCLMEHNSLVGEKKLFKGSQSYYCDKYRNENCFEGKQFMGGVDLVRKVFPGLN